MSVPVDRRSVWAVLGEEAVLEQAGQVHDPYADRPWQAPNEGFAVSAAGQLAKIPAEVIAAIRPPVPQQLFPPEFGYDDTPLTIEAVLDTNRWTPQQRSWVSPFDRTPEKAAFESPQYEGSSRPAMSSSPLG